MRKSIPADERLEEVAPTVHHTTQPKWNVIMNKDLLDILNCMTGADGGSSFIRLKVFIEEMETRESTGDDEAKQLMGVVRRFNNLIKYANKELK